MPQGVYVNTADVIGKYASSTLYAGDILTKAKLTKDANSADDVFATLDGSKVAVSVTIDTFAAGLSGKLQNGDIISLIVVDKNAGTFHVLAYLLYARLCGRNFISNHGLYRRPVRIYILSNSQEDIEKCKRAFFKWKDITQQ